MSYSNFQRVQNTAARITLRMPRTEHTTPLLRMLHWLPIPSRIAYNIDSPHCADYCISKISVRAVECVYSSQTTAQYWIQISSRLPQQEQSYGQRAFAYQEPINWNRVPGSIRTVEEKDTFNRHLKTAIIFSRMPQIST